jgi:hypothetical protein
MDGSQCSGGWIVLFVKMAAETELGLAIPGKKKKWVLEIQVSCSMSMQKQNKVFFCHTAGPKKARNPTESRHSHTLPSSWKAPYYPIHVSRDDCTPVNDGGTIRFFLALTLPISLHTVSPIDAQDCYIAY